jgi:hypothetical protein
MVVMVVVACCCCLLLLLWLLLLVVVVVVVVVKICRISFKILKAHLGKRISIHKRIFEIQPQLPTPNPNPSPNPTNTCMGCSTSGHSVSMAEPRDSRDPSGHTPPIAEEVTVVLMLLGRGARVQ